jgi:hypothetical protein
MLRLIQKEIQRRHNSGAASYLSFQKLLYSHLLSKYAKIGTNKIIVLLVVLYGCET